MTAPLAIIESAPARQEAHIKALWEAFRRADEERTKRGLEFGRAMYELRERGEVVPGGTTFRRVMENLEIPHTTAYRWIARYEESIGIREAPTTATLPAAVKIPGDDSGHGTDEPGRHEEKPSKREENSVESPRDRIAHDLSTMSEVRTFLNGLDVAPVARLFTDDELTQWIDDSWECRSAVDRFRLQLLAEQKRRAR